MEHLKTSDIILKTTEYPSQIIKFSLMKISTLTPKCGIGVGGWVDGYLRPDRFLDHLTVIKRKCFVLIMRKNATNFNFCIT